VTLPEGSGRAVGSGRSDNDRAAIAFRGQLLCLHLGDREIAVTDRQYGHLWGGGLLSRPRLWGAEGRRRQDGGGHGEGVASPQRRRSLDLDGCSIPNAPVRTSPSLPPEARPTAKRESPQSRGRVIAALYASGDLMHYSGRALIGAELGAQSASPTSTAATPLSLRYRLAGRRNSTPAPVMPLGISPVAAEPVCAFHSLGSDCLIRAKR